MKILNHLGTLCLTLLSTQSIAQSLSESERSACVAYLEETRNRIVLLTTGLNDEQLNFKPSPDVWSVHQNVEHLFIIEGITRDLVAKALEKQPTEGEKSTITEARIKEYFVVRTVDSRRVKAPERFQPTGQFKNFTETLAAFLEARNKTIEYIKTTNDNLRGHFTNMGTFATLDCYQWITYASAHSARHALQIEEVMNHQYFPNQNTISVEERKAALDYLNETSNKIELLTKSLSANQLNFKSNPDTWSIRDNVEHLVKVEGLVREIIVKALGKAPAEGEKSNIADNGIKEKLATRTAESQRFKAPDLLQPKQFNSFDETLNAFLSTRKQTLDFAIVTKADLRNHFAANPVLGTIDCYQYLIFIGAHTARHTLQMEEILRSKNFPQ